MSDGRRDASGATSPRLQGTRTHPGEAPGASDARLYSEVFPRNAPPLIAALAAWLGARAGRVLEIGCGTGQHAAAFELAFPDLQWNASDPDPAHRASAEAWRAHLRLPPRPALPLDAAQEWRGEAAALAPFEAVFSANVIHIAPPAVLAGILRGAAQALAPGGLLFFYGPFLDHGAHTGPGNAAFDAGLRASNPDWGLRDLADIVREAGALGLIEAGRRRMPADNRLLVLRKT
jgi:SAM-dependent methyltransferase